MKTRKVFFRQKTAGIFPVVFDVVGNCSGNKTDLRIEYAVNEEERHTIYSSLLQLHKEESTISPPAFGWRSTLSFKKGAACLYLFIRWLSNGKVNYTTVFLFPHYTLRMENINNRKEYSTKLLSGENGQSHELQVRCRCKSCGFESAKPCISNKKRQE